MGAFFNLECLIKTGLKDIVDKSLRDIGLIVLHHHRHLERQRFAVNDGGVGAGFDLHKGTVFSDGEHLGVIIPLHVRAKRLKRFVHRDHMRLAAVSVNRGLPGATERNGHGQCRSTGKKRRIASHRRPHLVVFIVLCQPYPDRRARKAFACICQVVCQSCQVKKRPGVHHTP